MKLNKHFINKLIIWMNTVIDISINLKCILYIFLFVYFWVWMCVCIIYIYMHNLLHFKIQYENLFIN